VNRNEALEKARLDITKNLTYNVGLNRWCITSEARTTKVLAQDRAVYALDLMGYTKGTSDFKMKPDRDKRVYTQKGILDEFSY